jgi:sulfoxide reductase heme-binding subunit YedZ
MAAPCEAGADMTSALWYLARGAGVTSLLLLTVVMVLGIAGRSGRPAFGLPRFAVNLVHRNAALMAVVFLLIHIVTLSFDPYSQLRVIDLVVPFGSTYRPVWVGLGALTSDLVIALVVTSLLRHRLGHRAWRLVHWLAYAAWPIALIHGLGSGTDRGTGWFLAIAVVCAATVMAAVGWRCTDRFRTSGGRRRLPTPVRALTTTGAQR